MHITDGLDLIDPARYAADGYPHETWARLRREHPVHRCEPERLASSFVAGVKHLPVRLRFAR